VASRAQKERLGENSHGWLKGCALGCGALALIPVLAIVIVSARTFFPLRAAGRAQAELEAHFGAPETFVPGPDGAIPPERIETFLEVRQAMNEPCERMESLRATMLEFDRGMEQEQDPSGREIAGVTWDLGRLISGLTPLVGDFFERRNLALLNQGMGLGEYVYIVALAYGGRFVDGSLDDELFAEDGPITPELQGSLRGMLVRQLDSFSARGAPESELRQLQLEIAAMHEDPLRLPWRDGLPAAIAESLEPFQDRLDEAYCQATAGIEMDRDTRRALAIALE